MLAAGISLILCQAARVEAAANALTVAYWTNTGGGGGTSASYSNSIADSMFGWATIVVNGDSDGGGTDDYACSATFTRSGNVFAIAGSGSDGNISSTSEFNYVNSAASFVKVVPTISYCGTPGSYAGCTAIGMKNSVVVIQSYASGLLGGVTFTHEFGHSEGIASHSAAPNVMATPANANNNRITAFQCEGPGPLGYPTNFSSPVDGDGPGSSGTMMPAATELDFSSVSIEELARSVIVDVTPVEAEDYYGDKDRERLIEMFGDKSELEHHTTIAVLIGLLSQGDDKDAEVLIDHIKQGAESATVAAAIISLGYVAERGSKVAMNYLAADASDEQSATRNIAVLGLGLTGAPEALDHLRELEQRGEQLEPDSGPIVTPSTKADQPPLAAALELETITTAISVHAEIASRGRRAYYESASRP